MKSVMLRVRVADGDMVLYKAAAKKAGEDLSAWVRRVLGAAVLDERSPPKSAKVITAPSREVPLPPASLAADIGAIVNETIASYVAGPDFLKDGPVVIGPPVEVEFRVNVEEDRQRSQEMYAEMVERAEADQYPTPAMRDPEEEVELLGPAMYREHGPETEPVISPTLPEPLEVAPIEPVVHDPLADKIEQAASVLAAQEPVDPDPRFRPAADCDSPSRCSRLQAPTCEPCKRAHALATFAVPSVRAYEPPKPWKRGKRAPGCITKTCERIAAPACDPCRRFNAEVEF